MKKFKRTIAGISAMSLALSLAACGGSSTGGGGGDAGGNNGGGGEEPEVTFETTTAATVEINTETRNDDEVDVIQNCMGMLRDYELPSDEVKWLCHWDLNPDTTGKKLPAALDMFQQKYGAHIKWYQTTWQARFTDLSNQVLGGEGIDFFQRDPECLPKGVISGMFQPVDEYLDMDSDLWKDVKPAMEAYNFNGKHYTLATGISAFAVVHYSKKTIEEYGLDDPWELYEQGEWNWDTFTDMLQTFCEASDDNYGLDGWWSELALYRSAGVPCISSNNGELTVNLDDPAIERAMNMMLDLYNKGCVCPKEQFGWGESPHFMGEGRELFWIQGIYQIRADPETWSIGVPAEDVAIAPVPNAPDAEHPWQDAVVDGYCICKGAANPMGAVLYAECDRAAALDPAVVAIGDDDCRNVFMWSEDTIERNKIINDLAAKYPVIDIAAGISPDVASLTTDGGEQIGLRAAMHGFEWATSREEVADAVRDLVAEANDEIKKVG